MQNPNLLNPQLNPVLIAQDMQTESPTLSNQDSHLEDASKIVNDNDDNVLDNLKNSGILNSRLLDLLARVETVKADLLTIQTELNHLLPQDITKSQIELLQYILMGKKNPEIAQLMQVTEPSVRTYVSSLYRKLNVSNRQQLINKFQ